MTEQLMVRDTHAALLDIPAAEPPEIIVPPTSTRATTAEPAKVDPAVLKSWQELTLNTAAWALTVQENVEAAQINRERGGWPVSLVQGRLALQFAQAANQAAGRYDGEDCKRNYDKSVELHNVFLTACATAQGVVDGRRAGKAGR